MFDGKSIVEITEERFASETINSVWEHFKTGSLVKQKNMPKGVEVLNYDSFQYSTLDGIIHRNEWLIDILINKPYEKTQKELDEDATKQKAAQYVSSLLSQIETLTERLAAERKECSNWETQALNAKCTFCAEHGHN